MEYTIEFGGYPQDVTITVTGVADAEGLVGLVHDVVGDPRFRPGMLILEDCLGIDVSQVKASDFRAQADTIIRLDHKIGASKTAIIVPSPVTFGFARMSQAFGESAALEAGVFYSRSEALEWLASQRALAGSQPEG